MTDFHSHILPSLDDGAKDIDESIAILDMMAKTGVKTVYCTPHFYPHKQSVEDFLDHRASAYERLRPHLKPGHPKLKMGAEVLLSSSLLTKDGLLRLKLEDTDFVLIEMPYVHFSQSIYDGFDSIADMSDVKVLVAHVERYLAFNSESEVERLFAGENALGQINCTSLRGFGARRKCLRLIKEGYVHSLGTDYHRIERNYAFMDEGMSILKKKLSKEQFERLKKTSEMIAQNCEIEEILEQ